MLTYPVLVILISLLDITYGQPPIGGGGGGDNDFEQYYGKSCGSHLPAFLNTNCPRYDPNLYCDASEKVCRCKPPYVKLQRQDLCYNAAQDVDIGVFRPGNITGRVKRYRDCEFIVILDATSFFSAGGGTPNYFWYCAFDPNDLPDKENRENYDKTNNGCFGDGIMLRDQTQIVPFYFIRSESLPCTATTYYFRMFFKNRYNSSVSDLTATLRNEFVPDIDIYCQKNCGEKVNPSERLVQIADCPNCYDTRIREQITYVWEIVAPALNLDDITIPGGSDAAMIIAADALENNVTYTFNVTATLPDGSQAWEAIDLLTRPGMIVGTCEILPTQGFVTITLHSITCRDFKDPEENDLQYTLREKSEDSLGHLLYSSLYPEMKDVSLPLGNKDDDWKLGLTVTACSIEEDPLCATVDIGVVRVEPNPDLDVAHLSDKLEEETDPQDAMQKSLSFSTILNTQGEMDKEEGDAEESNENRNKRRMVREKIVATLNDVEVDSIAVVQQKTSVLFEVTKEKTELTDTSLTSGTGVVNDLASSFIEHNANATSKEAEETGKSLINVVSTLMTEVVQSKTGIDASGNETKHIKKRVTNIDHRKVTQGLLTSLNSVKETLAGTKAEGETPTVVNTRDLTVKVDKRKPSALQGLQVEVESGQGKNASKVELPQNFPVPKTDENLDIEAVHFKANPFVWSDTANEVTSPVTQLQLKRTEEDIVNYVLDAKDLPEPLRVVIPQNLIEIEPGNVTMAHNVTAFIVFNKTTAESKVMVYLDGSRGDLPPDATFHTAIYFVNTTGEDIDNLGEFTNSTNATAVFNETIFLGNGEKWLEPKIPKKGTYYIEMKLDSKEKPDNVTFHMFVSQIKCLYWDDGKEEWSHEGCYAGDESTPTELVCYCNHMTSFAGGFLVMPNKLNFKEDIAKFLTFWENPVGIAAVGAVLFIYLIAVIFAWKKDREDYLRGAVVNLADNDPSYQYTYIVTVQTGSRRNAGSTANCCCVLIGLRGESEPHILFSSSNPMCQRGNMDNFVIRTKYSLGPVTRIKFWHDNTGDSPEWFINTCRVIDTQKGEMYTFVCNFWLADCLGDQTIVKTFKIATEAEQQELEYLFFTNATDAMQDTHMWLSPYAHQPDSNFTTVQRVSCCLSLFMTYMITNIMFYGIEPEKGGEQKMDLGPTSITWTELRIGVMSAVIMLPANILLITIFKNVRRRYARNLYHVHFDTLRMHLALNAIKEDELEDLQKLAEFESSISQSESQYMHSEPVDLAKVSLPVFPHAVQSHEMDPGTLEREKWIREIAKGKKRRCQCKCMLPWWFVYINWVFLFLIVVACGFFTILYTFNYGLEVSIKWLSSLLVAFMGDAFLTQPFKVVIVALVFSLIFKSTLSEPRNINVNTDHTSFKGFKTTAEANELRRDLNVYIPPEQVPSRPDADLIKIQNDEKVHGLFFEIVRYVIFLYLVLLITYGRQDMNQFNLNAFISEQVIAEEDMAECGDLASIWEYVTETLLEGLYDPEFEEYVNGIDSLRLAPPILIQTRRPRCTVEPHWWLKKMGITGRHWECRYLDSDETDYGEEWDDNSTTNSPVWRFNTTYNGYVAELTNSQAGSAARLAYLGDSLWMDRFTTSLTIKVVMYNPILNLMSLLEVTFVINDPVGVQAEKNLESFKMYRSTRGFSVFVLLQEIMYVVYAVYFMIYVIKCIYRERRKYFKSVWSFLDLFVVLVSLNVIAIYICHAFFTDQAVLRFHETGEVDQFDTVLLLHSYVTYVLGLLVTCAVFKFINMLRFNPIIFRFLEVLDRAKGGLIWSMFVVVLLHFQFGGMFHIVAAGRIEMFRSVGASMMELFISVLGEYDVEYLQIIDPVIGPLAFLTFLIFTLFVAINMMTSILIWTLRRVKKEKLPDDDARLLALLIDRILQWLGIMKHKGGKRKKSNKKDREDEEKIIKETTYV